MSLDEGRAHPRRGHPHPVVWFAQRAHEVLDEVLAGGVHVATLPAPVTAEAVEALHRLADRVEAVKAALLPHAETVDVAATASPVATSTGAWLAQVTRTSAGQVRRQVKTARRLDSDYTATRDAALAGDVSPRRSRSPSPRWMTSRPGSTPSNGSARRST